MAKDENIDASTNGVSPNGAIDPQERAFLDRLHARYDALSEQLKAEGFDGSEYLPELRRRAATWSR